MRIHDLTGMQFTRLKVICRNPQNLGNKPAWICQCDCGKNVVVRASDLEYNKQRSCGCLQIDSVSTHRMSYDRTYQSWSCMKQRCTNQSTNGYEKYGGRGITVCQRWLESFENFLEDMGQRPSGMSIDRIDVNGNYEPSNCRWATAKTQSTNRRIRSGYTYKGVTKPITKWCEELGHSYTFLMKRMKSGMSFEEAVDTPITHDTKCRIDLTGKKFGLLTVLNYHDTIDNRAYWLCSCDCGKQHVANGKELRGGHTKSCGCNRGRPGVKKGPRKLKS